MPRLFGEKVRALRRQREMTQVELARKLGLAAHTHITKLEAGQDLRMELKVGARLVAQSARRADRDASGAVVRSAIRSPLPGSAAP